MTTRTSAKPKSKARVKRVSNKESLVELSPKKAQRTGSNSTSKSGTKRLTAKAKTKSAGAPKPKDIGGTQAKPKAKRKVALKKSNRSPAVGKRTKVTTTKANQKPTNAKSRTSTKKVPTANKTPRRKVTKVTKESQLTSQTKSEVKAASPKKARKVSPKPRVSKRTRTPRRQPEVAVRSIENPLSDLQSSRQLASTGLSGGFGSVIFTPYEPGKREPHMSPKQRQHFLSILTQWHDALSAIAERKGTTLQDDSNNLPDPVDAGTNESVFHNRLRACDRERQLIVKIARAIDKIESGDYGYCEACGVEIGLRRLEARPIATKCVDCKHLDELRERQRGW